MGVLGKMKDEMGGKKIHEFVGLRSKVYSLKYECGDNTIEEKHRVKGINRNSSERIKHEEYLNVLTESTKTDCEITQFKCKNQKVSTIRFKKDCLSCYDDKRWICDDGFSSYANEHYRTKSTEQPQTNQ